MKRLIKFEKEHCAPCQSVSAFFDRLGVPHQRINPFEDPEMAAKNRVRSVPTVILFDGEREEGRVVGYKPEELEELVERLA